MKSKSLVIVAEIGSVHDGSFGNALKLIELAKECGAHIVKFQFHIPEEESLDSAPSPKFFTSESRFEYFRRTAFSASQWSELYSATREIGLIFGCSVFSTKALELLIDSGVDVLKVPSGEVTNHPLLSEVASTNLPIHLSSGMSNWREIDEAMGIFQNCKELTLLQCTSKYPATSKDIGLNMIPLMRERYSVPVGLSDHSLGTEFSVAAVALGVTVIEKHLTFSRKMYGSDAFNALEPVEFLDLSTKAQTVFEAINNPVEKDDLSQFQEMRAVFQKSIVINTPVAEGQVLELDMLKFLKPGTGLPPSDLAKVIGRKTKRSLPLNHILKLEDLQ